jgi:hypothetical protein
VDGELFIAFSQHPGEEVFVTICDAIGRPLFTEEIIVNESYQAVITLNLRDGFYLMIIKTNKGTDQRRIVIRDR